MPWIQWVTLIAAVVSALAASGVLLQGHFRDKSRAVVTPSLEKRDGKYRLAIKLSNRGNTELYLDKIWLAGGDVGMPPRWQLSLYDDFRHPKLNKPIPPRNAYVAEASIEKLGVPILRNMFTVVVEFQDGTVVQQLFPELRALRPLFEEAPASPGIRDKREEGQP